MRFGWINGFGACVVVLLLIPNLVYARKNREVKNACRNRFMNGLEQVGRYACLILMWLPFPVGKFGFRSVGEMVLYFVGTVLLLAAYHAFWAAYGKKKSRENALALAIIPTVMFLVCGLLLRHWLLAAAAIAFGIGHVYVTDCNNAAAEEHG